MRIALIAIGTRGDVEPFLAVAEVLRDHGHECTCALPAQYLDLATQKGFPAFGFDRAFLDLLEGVEGRAFMGGKGSPFHRLRAFFHLAKEGLRINRNLVAEQQEFLSDASFDRVVFHPKAGFVHVWSAVHPGRAVMLSPVPWVIHPVVGHAHLGFGLFRKLRLSRLSYRLANFALSLNVLPPTKAYRANYGISARDIRRSLEDTKLFYNVSPKLFPPAPDWPANVRVLGFFRRITAKVGEENPAVSAFMDRHEKFIVVTFGSMMNDRPRQVTDIVLRSLDRHRIPAILNCAGGGMIEPEVYDRERMLFVTDLPYDRVFPRAYAVIHHGGAGTTQTALTYGCASMIVPHIIDQFSWNRLIAERGLGPLGPPVRTLSIETFAPRLKDLYANPIYRSAARKLGATMRSEDHRDEVVEFIADQAIPLTNAPRNP